MKNKRLEFKRAIVLLRTAVSIIAISTAQCEYEFMDLYISINEWPNESIGARLLYQNEYRYRYIREKPNRVQISNPEQYLPIRFEAIDEFDCTIAVSDIGKESPTWPRQWVHASLSWHTLSSKNCPIEYYSSTLQWENPILGNSLSLRIWGSSPKNIWIVDMNGAAWHYDGQTWKNTKHDAGVGLTAVWGLSENDVWASGTDGSIFHWNGSIWSKKHDVRSRENSYQHINEIFGFSAADIYAVGRDGLITHWNGSYWRNIESRTKSDLYTIWGSSNNDIWVGGFGGAVLRFNGMKWNEIALPPKGGGEGDFKSTIFGIWGSPSSGSAPSTNVWLVGDSGTRIRWNGEKFMHFDSMNYHWHGVTGFHSQTYPGDEVWVAGKGNQLERLSNGTWNTYRVDGIDSMDKVFATTDNDMWAVGVYGRVFHWKDNGWDRLRTGHTDAIRTLWLDGSRNVWAGGGGGCMIKAGISTPNAAIFRRLDSAWIQIDGFQQPGCVLSGWSNNQGKMWIVWTRPGDSERSAEGVISYHNEALMKWEQETFPGKMNILFSVWGTAQIVMAVGSDGTIIRRHDGKWQREQSPTSENLFAVWGNSENDIWAVGDNGTILRRVGSSTNGHWTLVPTPVPGRAIYGIRGVDAHDIWAVGQDGLILHWNGNNWTDRSVVLRNKPTIRAVWTDRSESAWAVGDQGTILFWNNWTLLWEQVPTAVRHNFYGITGNASTIWIGGDDGTTLRIRRKLSTSDINVE